MLTITDVRTDSAMRVIDWIYRHGFPTFEMFGDTGDIVDITRGKEFTQDSDNAEKLNIVRAWLYYCFKNIKDPPREVNEYHRYLILFFLDVLSGGDMRNAPAIQYNRTSLRQSCEFLRSVANKETRFGTKTVESLKKEWYDL